MGPWIPNKGSMYRTLLDRCVGIFDIESLPEKPMHGDPGGWRCEGNWDCGDLFIFIRTPQHYGHNPVRHNLKELRGWPLCSDEANPKTGFLSVSRIVKSASPHFEWIEPHSIISAFDLSFSQFDAETARNMVRAFNDDNDWLIPELTPDGNYMFVRSSIADPLAIRFRALLRNTSALIVIWEAQNLAGLDVFYNQVGFRVADMKHFFSRAPDSHRLETLGYEFELIGKSSWDFQIAK